MLLEIPKGAGRPEKIINSNINNLIPTKFNELEKLVFIFKNLFDLPYI